MSNRLKNEKSPYLLQHAENPVDWYPWCTEAFEKAQREDKPVFLSIGYSTCHWCHVMAQESFEDVQVAELLNRYFVSIKVDREERPDIDAVYMRVCTAVNGSGGWPLTAILTPHQQPIYVGTYLPKNNRGGAVGLLPLLTALADRWHSDRKSLLKTASELTNIVSREPVRAGVKADGKLADSAYSQLKSSYDEEYGGFGTAPKFPSAHNLIFLMRYAALKKQPEARQMAENTLRQMYKGGIYDHIGGGFCRYSTDREWLKPHFEKTLYDNALLALAYTEAWEDGHMALWRSVAENTLDYCMRELLSEGGGYYCAQDADCGGVEGAYYLLSPKEVADVLGADEGRHFCECYDITDEGNFREKSIPNLLLNTRWCFLPEGYDEHREKLRLYRDERYSLGTDTKILTGWNGLMLMALSRAAAVFRDKRYLNAAQELSGFMREKLFANGELMARLCGGELKFDAGLEDYCFYALGLLELYRADFNAENLKLAIELAELVIKHFSDPKGGLFSTSDKAERLLLRPKSCFDGALPSGCSAAAVLFEKLFRLSGDVRWRDESDRVLNYIASNAGSYPAGCCCALSAVICREANTQELVCVTADNNRPQAVDTILSRYSPTLSVLIKNPENEALLSAIAPFTAEMKLQNGKTTYYLCSGGMCSAPITEL